MEFEKRTPEESEGAILAHSLPLKNHRLRKGAVLTDADIRDLVAEGYAFIRVAIPGQDDMVEDDAALSLAMALQGERVRVERPLMGRCNLWAESYGLLVLEHDILDTINLVHESMTVATLKPFAIVSDSQLLATVKAIPYAVATDVIRKCHDILAQHPAAIRVRPFQRYSVGLIQTSLGTPKDDLLDKTRTVLSNRLHNLNSSIGWEVRCQHEEEALVSAIHELRQQGVDMMVISGASAVVDRRDVIPSAITAVGGAVRHYGMPVDPGNLLLLAGVDDIPVLGMPGCARSPKYNGFDMVLERLIAGLDVSARDIMSMGVGGLLNEIGTRPQPRVTTHAAAVASKARKITALVLAAGESKRMGDDNKLLLEFGGRPMIAHTLENLVNSCIDDILVITGKDEDRIRLALGQYDLEFVHNACYADGISTSIICGLNRLDDNSEAVLVVLGDMPMISSECLERLVTSLDPEGGCEICVPVYDGKWGNPVLWSRRFFQEMMHLDGDHGARHLLYKHAEVVKEVEMPDAGVLMDFDTRESLSDLQLQ